MSAERGVTDEDIRAIIRQRKTCRYEDCSDCLGFARAILALAAERAATVAEKHGDDPMNPHEHGTLEAPLSCDQMIACEIRRALLGEKG